MRRADGYHVWTDRENGRTLMERDSVTCAHCGAHVFADPSLGWCGRCARAVCGPCVSEGRCTPLERRLEQALRQGR